jgi:hypothetical protein
MSIGGATERSELDELNTGVILVAFEKLFGGGRGVAKNRPGLRYVNISSDTILIEQNPREKNEWGELVQQGKRVAWVICEGNRIARIVDGAITKLV